MAEKPYQKREIDHYFSDLFKRLDKQDINLKDISDKVGFQNGRVRKLEDWTEEARKVIEKSTETGEDYKREKVRLYTIMSVLVLVGGAFITLSVRQIHIWIREEAKTAAIKIL